MNRLKEYLSHHDPVGNQMDIKSFQANRPISTNQYYKNSSIVSEPIYQNSFDQNDSSINIRNQGRHHHNSSGFLSSVPRFKSLKKSEGAGLGGQYSTLSKRSASFGMGKRLGIINKSLLQNPGPGNYDLNSSFHSKSGKSFGLSFEAYKKTVVMDVPQQPGIQGDSPGPGYYEIIKPIGHDRRKCSLYSTVNRFPSIKSHTPAPGTYMPKDLPSGRFRNITFGLGKRKLDSGPPKDTPGPGTYRIPSKFDQIVEKNKRAISVSKIRYKQSNGSLKRSTTQPKVQDEYYEN